MSGRSGWWSIRKLLRRDVDAEARSELDYHIQSRAEDLERRGMSPAEARAEALRRFGNLDQISREVIEIDHAALRTRKRTEWLGDLFQDLRLAVRGMRRSPTFALSAVGTLGIAIGGATAVFSVVDDTLLRPLPVASPDALMMVWEENPEKGWFQETVAAANLLDWRDRIPAFQDVAAYTGEDEEMTLSLGSGPAEVVAARLATGNLFSVLGVPASEGRVFRWEEGWDTAGAVAVVSHAAWVQRLGADPAIVGQMIRLDGIDHQVIGILPETFALTGIGADIWVPFRWSPAAVTDLSFRRAHWLRAIARLEPGSSPEVAAGQLSAVMAELESEYPETNSQMGAGITPLQEFLVGDRRMVLFAIFGAAALLFLLACANVGNLILVRSLARSQEVAVRNALGARRSRLFRQGLAENLALALAGIILALPVATLLLAFLQRSSFSAGFPIDGLQLSVRLTAFLGIALLLCLTAFTLLPVVLSSASGPASQLRDDGRASTAGPRGRRTARLLAGSEVGIAFVLIMGAILLTRSYLELHKVDPGFDSTAVLTASLTIPNARYPDDRSLATLLPQLVAAAEEVPGVSSAALVRQLPMTRPAWSSDFAIRGRAADDFGVEVLHREITPKYFETLLVPLVSGREFRDNDDQTPDSESVIIINEALAERHFRGENPIGQRIAFTRTPGPTTTWRTVVGVVGNEQQSVPSLPPRMEIFSPLAQDPTTGVALVVRGLAADPNALASPVRQALQRVDSELGIFDVRSMAEVESTATARERLLVLLLGTFAAVAFLLALVGVYGVMAQTVRERRREIGVRMALGAIRLQIVSLVARQTLHILVGGMIAGLIVSLLGSRAVATLLFGVSPADPVTLVIVPLLLLPAGIAAALIPAVRAGKIDPAGIFRMD